MNFWNFSFFVLFRTERHCNFVDVTKEMMIPDSYLNEHNRFCLLLIFMYNSCAKASILINRWMFFLRIRSNEKIACMRLERLRGHVIDV